MIMLMKRRLLIATILTLLCAATVIAQSSVRAVTGQFNKVGSAAPWAGAKITFKLERSTYTATNQFPPSEVVATTDSLGRMGDGVCTLPDGPDADSSPDPCVSLWTNAEGLRPVQYRCVLPGGDSFLFYLAPGDPIAIGPLRAGATTEPSASNQAVLQSIVDSHAAATDPHPVYLMQPEGDARYALLGGSGITDHGALTGLADDDHPQYQLRSEKNTAGGYAGLDGSALLPDNRLPASIARDTEVSAAVAAHEGAADPHAVYLTQPEGDARYAALGSGVTDHGALTGLGDDDHPQYLNTARGDARYYTQTQLDVFLAAKAAAVHSHAISDTTGLQAALDAKAASVHTHTLADVTDEGTAAALNVAASGNAAAGQVVKGNDTRLTDARAPTSHSHVDADIPNNITVDLAALATTATTANAGDSATGFFPTGTLESARGGTGSAFFAVAGPTAPRTFTFPDAAATLARTDAAQTFNDVQTFGGNINLGGNRLLLTNGGIKSSFSNTLAARNTADNGYANFRANGFFATRSDDSLGLDIGLGAVDQLRIGSGGLVGFSATANSNGGLDVAVNRAAAGGLGLTNGSTGGGFLEFIEMTMPAAPAANKARLFVRDNGAGKTEIVVRFASGAEQVIATEP